ncbi:MAG: glycoside hydrolase family 10 protein [Gemmatimonadaceae bacterium]
MPLRFPFAPAALLAFLAACSGSTGDISGPPVTPPPDTAAPPVAREMRGLWIATVANIDWPSRNNLTADAQRAELVDIMTRAAAMRINTIVFHVRPAGDALYESSLEPWGIMLTGTQGASPGYDPLAFAIEEAHKRGMELHAWVNPFRAGNTADTLRLVSPHIFRARRDLVRVYGGNIWMDPGEPEVQDHSMRVIADIVSRYDIDGIHADDYFYPYQINDNMGRLVPFPDDGSYSRHSGGLPRDDWRRANIDRFVERMYREVHAIKPTMKVGLSPFGIWRPGFPPGVTGLDAYGTIYADSRKWLQQGWVDYLAPQLYWAIGSSGQSYPALLDWWIAQNPMGRHVWPGLAAYRVNDGTASAFSMQEIPEQIRLTRSRPQASGNILYNTSWTLNRNGGALASALAGDLYRNPALVPSMPWLDATPPLAPSIAVVGGQLQITPGAGEESRWWTVRARTASGWATRIHFGSERSIQLDSSVERVLVQAVDRVGNSSAAAEWRR